MFFTLTPLFPSSLPQHSISAPLASSKAESICDRAPENKDREFSDIWKSEMITLTAAEPQIAKT